MSEGGWDLLLDGRLRLRQPVSGHRVGSDAVILAATLADPGPVVVDAGAGVGAVGLAVGLRAPGAAVTLIERDAALGALARENIEMNGLAGRATIAVCDLLSARSRRAAGVADARASAVFTNPPFYAAAAVRASPDPARAAAHVLAPGGVGAWMRACLALLAPDGRFAMIHLPEALAPILEACAGRLGAVRILPVHPRVDAPARRIVIAGRKGSRAATSIAPGLVLHEADGRFTPLAEAIHRGQALLDL